MTSASPSMLPPRSVQFGAAAAHAALAAWFVVLFVSSSAVELPVALSIAGDGPGVFAHVELALACAIVMLVSVAARALIASTAAPSEARLLTARMLELSQTAAITVFLIAQLNGVVEAGALILVYATAAAAVAVLWMHGRGSVVLQRSAWPYSVAAAIAVVPWGVIALYQVTALALGDGPPSLVRVLTVVVLLLAAAGWWIERQVHRGILGRERAEVGHVVLTLSTGLALLFLTVGLQG